MATRKVLSPRERGRLGGLARARNLTKEEKRRGARKASRARWARAGKRAPKKVAR